MKTKRQKFILSPCGTSLLTNLADGDERGAITRSSNCRERGEVAQVDLAALERVIGRAKKALAQAGPAEAGKLSAELNGITSIFEGQVPAKDSFHQLVSTDTFLGQATAEIVGE